MAKKLPRHVHVKRSRGRTYYYFDTGVRVDGKVKLTRLPDISDTLRFSNAWANAVNARSRRTQRAEAMTFGKLLDLYFVSHEFRKKSASTQENYILYAKEARRLFGNAPANEIETKDITLMMDTMAERPGAANMTLAVIGAVYAWGRQRGHVTNRPTQDVKAFESKDYEPWPAELIALALSDPDPVIRLSVALLYYTAQRIGDVCKMRWADVRDGAIHITQQKTGKDMVLPIHAGLRPHLPKPDGIFVLTSEGRPMNVDWVRARLQKWAKAKGYKIVPHGLRKNAVNALLEAGCSIGETSAISGQSLQIVEHYAKRRDTTTMATAAILRWEANGS